MLDKQVMQDEQIVGLFWERSERALSETQRKYNAYCMYIAENILHNREDAMECTNDAYLRLWNLIPPHRPEKLSAFLGKIVRGFAIDRSRRNHAAKRGGGETEVVLEELEECLSEPSVPEETQEQMLLSDILNRFLEGLPKQTRIIFVQRYFYLCPVRDIARDLGLGESMVKTTLFRTRNALRERLEEEGISV